MKKRLKKMLSILLCLAVVFSMAACGENGSEDSGDGGTPTIRVGVSWHEKQSTNVTGSVK